MRIRIIRYLDLVEKKPTGFCHYDIEGEKSVCRGKMHESDALNLLYRELRNYLKRNGHLNVEVR